MRVKSSDPNGAWSSTPIQSGDIIDYNAVTGTLTIARGGQPLRWKHDDDKIIMHFSHKTHLESLLEVICDMMNMNFVEVSVHSDRYRYRFDAVRH